MRHLAAAFLLMGCATALPPPERIDGCWISRSEHGGAETMRWLPDPAQPGVLVGHYLSYPDVPDSARTYTLTPDGDGWRFCEAQAEGGDQCWAVAQGSSGSLEGGRAFIDAHAGRLRIAILDGAFERLIFQGERDGCD